MRRLVEEQRKLIEKLSKQLANQKTRIEQLEAELLAKKKLKGKPKLSASLLNQPEPKEHQIFEREQHQVLRAGLETATYIHTDDTGARHNGKNGYCTVIGNDDFAYFHSSDSKSRENFLEILQAGERKYVLNENAKAYLENYQLPQKHLIELEFSDEPLATTKEEWGEHLLSLGIKNLKIVRVLTEAALIGGLKLEGRSEPLRILSDGAGQFNVMQHGLCWVHIERGLRKLEGDNDQERENIVEMQGLLWEYYQELKQYQQSPSTESSLLLHGKFDEIFGRCYIRHGLLNNVLSQIRHHKIELLQALDCPEFPLHNNAAETDIREYVTRRKISGGTRSELGRRARDTFVGLKKTCRKLEISFWNYLTSRLHHDEQVLFLSDVIRTKAVAKIPVPA